MGKEKIPSNEMDTVIINLPKVREMKAKSTKKRQNASLKPLKFDIDPADSPLKAEIIKRINERNLTYGDLHEYCTNQIKNGDVAEGRKLGYNIISSIKNCHTMVDTTFALLCDFLNLDICLVDRNKIEPPTDLDDNESEESPE